MIYISQLLETDELEKLLKAYPMGLEIISFSIGYLLDDLEKNINAYEKEFKNLRGQVPFSFHGPFLDLLPGSCDDKVRSLARERFEAGHKAAKAFGAKQMIFHTGYIPNTYPDKYWLENTILFWKEFLKEKLEDCFFYVENVLDTDYELLKRLVEAMDHPHFKVCLDIGHINAYSKRPVQEWIKGLGDLIGYVHLHNNDGTKDGHKSLIRGTIPMEEVLYLLKEKAPQAHWSLEIGDKEELQESINWLIDKKFL